MPEALCLRSAPRGGDVSVGQADGVERAEVARQADDPPVNGCEDKAAVEGQVHPDEGAFDVATLVYNHFKSVITQLPTAQQLIPPELGAKDENAPVYDYEPDEGEILAELLPRAVTVRVYRGLLENQASFFGAQMSAMDNATRNAGEMVKKYTLRYNRTRQAMITKELIEIISGAEAL